MTEPRQHTIAIIDDDPDTLLLAATVLTAAGHRVITDDGRPGTGHRLADTTPDLILLDLHLGARDGEDALHEIRAEHRLAAVPVLGFTAALPQDRSLTRLEERLAGRIAKPVDPVSLVSAVARALGHEPAPPENTAVETGHDDDLASLRQRFINGLHGRADLIAEAAAKQDSNALALEIHRLRGAAGAWNLGDLAAEAANAERLLRSGSADAPDAITRLLATIRQHLQ